MFTNTDKALLNRGARYLKGEAAKLEKAYGQQSWGADKQCRKAKLEYDRQMRDARDLDALATRLVKFSKSYAAGQQSLVPTP